MSVTESCLRFALIKMANLSRFYN